MRAYGTTPQVWLNGHEPCTEHDWIDATARRVYSEKTAHTENTTLGAAKAQDGRINASQGNTCLVCGAWRGELGLEPTPELYVEHLVAIFREVRRVMRDDATLWLNLGDSFAGSGAGGGGNRKGNEHGQHDVMAQIGRPKVTDGLKPKDLVGIPWMVAFALRADGWYLRSDIIWAKPNPMPESVRDRPTKAHEYIFLMSKSPRYYYDAEAIKENPNSTCIRKGTKGGHHLTQIDGYKGIAGGTLKRDPDEPYGFARDIITHGRNRRSVWTVTTHPYKGAHFATFPPDLIEPMILAGTSERGVCPQCGAPWERVTERVREHGLSDIAFPKSDGTDATARLHRRLKAARDAGEPHDNALGGTTTTGWRPSCTCDAGAPVPATVMDIFSGAGTTGVVAVKHGRNYVGIDLKADYNEMARERIGKVQIELQGAH